MQRIDAQGGEGTEADGGEEPRGVQRIDAQGGEGTEADGALMKCTHTATNHI